MPEFTDPPTVKVLQALVGDSNPREPKSISMSVRRWYTLKELYDNFSDDLLFTDTKWREKLYRGELTNWDTYPSLMEGCISTKTIKDIIEDANIPWLAWTESYLNFYGQNSNSDLTFRKLENRLHKIENLQPFYFNSKTIQNDLKYFCAEGYLIDRGYKTQEDWNADPNSTEKGHQYALADKDQFLKLSRSQMSESLAVNTLVKTYQTAEPGLSDNFQDFADVFWKSSYPNQRFYIHSDYEFQKDITKDVGRYRQQLAEVWLGEKGFPCKLTYYSASKNKVYTAIIYPVCIYYYQRAFYLCACSCKEDETESNWYNYRLDRFQNLEVLDWQSDLIPKALRYRCNIDDDFELIDEIASELIRAYGFDIALPQQTMLLRFEKDFHDRYIKNTWRHNSFKLVEIDKIEAIPGMKQAGLELINSRIDRHQNDAYYTMNYRVGDNSVIMRLRAWCPNVEVLFPLDLRKRMRDDIEKTWDLYRLDRL